MKFYLELIAMLIASISLYGQKQEIYVSDAGNFNKLPWQILKFDINGQNPSQFITSKLNWPQDILFLEKSNEVLISNLGSGCITKHNASTGEYISNFACSIAGPTRIKIGPDSLLYVLQWKGSGMVRRYNLEGEYLGDFTNKGVAQSIGLDWDRDNKLYVSSYNGDFVRKFDSNGKDMGLFINSNLVGPTNIWFDDDGDLLVSDYDGGAIKRFDAEGKFKNSFITGLNRSEGIAFLPNGDILIGNGGTSSVKMYDQDGQYIKDLIQSGTAHLINPNAIVIREIETSSSVDFKDDPTPLISPSMGVEFKIRPEILNKIKFIEVIDESGKFVTHINQIEDTLLLDQFPEGVYFITIQFLAGHLSSQRIIIQK